jgi:hypothetical protein
MYEHNVICMDVFQQGLHSGNAVLEAGPSNNREHQTLHLLHSHMRHTQAYTGVDDVMYEPFCTLDFYLCTK